MFLTMKRSSFIQTFLFLFHFILFIYLFLIYTLKEYWAIPFFIHTGVWTTKFWKTSTPWKEWLFDSSGILWNFNLRQFDHSEKNDTWKNFWVCHPEKGKHSKFTPWKNIPWDRNPWKNYNQGTPWIFTSIPMYG